MANSRSNIYPVQLQGAELNLNKFDAEIKQYSGFNKNNSPFVGGCLSNLFTKDTTIEGATKNSVYISKEGDVYKVDESGLYKNGEIVFTKKGEALEQVEIDLPSNVVCFYKEDVYITSETPTGDYPYGYFVFHCGDYENIIDAYAEETGYGVSHKFIYYTSFDIEHIQDSNIGDVYCVAYQGMKAQTSGKVGVLRCYVYSRVSEGETFTRTFLESYYYSSSFLGNLTKDSIGKVCLFPLENNAGFFVSGVYEVKKGIVYSGGTWSFCDAQTDSGAAVQCYTFYKKNYDGNIIALKVKDSAAGYIHSKVTRLYFDTNTVHCVLENYIFYSTYKLIEIKNSLKTQYGGISICKQTTDSDINFYGAYCDFGTYVTKNDTNDYVCNFGCVLGNIFLANNNVVTGLSLGGNILLTEWNSIDPSGDNVYYFYDRKELYYKDINSNKWIKFFVGIPKVRFENNQIITNFNQLDNAYSLLKNKIVTFASAYNNRLYMHIVSSSQQVAGIQDTDDFCYVASAMNEYNLAENASLLLNPVRKMGSFPSSTLNDYTEINSNFLIDYYASDLNGVEVKYLKSEYVIGQTYTPPYAWTTWAYKEDLVGLDFPSDTNGNVMYSPSLFAEFFSSFGNEYFIKINNSAYQLSKYDSLPIMSFYLGTLINDLSDLFILQGQYYGIINNQIFSIIFNNGVIQSMTSVVSVENLQFCGNTPYEALFYSKTNRCLYAFNGANVLQQKQLVDKISVVKSYKYNPATQSIFLLTDIGVIISGLFGTYLIDMPEAECVFLLNNGIVLGDNNGNYRYIRYYLEESDTDYTKQNIELQTAFYGMNNETVTINDCLYLRLFSEEHEEGEVKVSATTISLRGRKTEETVFRFKASDWDALTHSVYVRYQPKEQRGLGISFSINSPFKIASMSIGSKADAILIDRVSKGAINAPEITSNNIEW